MSTLEAEVESCDAVFFSEFAELLKLVVSPSGMQHLRTPSRTFFPAGASPMRRPSPLSLYPWRESHAKCIRVRAESKLTIPFVHPERPASLLAAAGAPRRPMRLVGPPPSHAAHDCLRAAGPRATPCTASDEPGRLLCFLVIIFLIVLSFLLELSVCGIEVSGGVL